MTLISRPLAVLLLSTALPVLAQSPASEFARGNSMQAWQHPDYASVLAQCENPPQPFRIGGGGASTADSSAEPPAPELPTAAGIEGIIEAGKQWRVVWAWQGNNADGPIGESDGSVLFANNDASNVMKLDPATGLATILFDDVNTGGGLSRSKNGSLLLANRGLHPVIMQLEPTHQLLADSINGEPLDCVGGVINDLSADSKGGAYVAVSGVGVLHSTPQGEVTLYDGIAGANGIILSPDESVLYVTNGATLVAFDVAADGTLHKQRDFAQLSGSGDGSAVDNEGRIFVATGASVDIISPTGETLGIIPGPRGIHGVAFGGKNKQTLFGIVFYGGWGTASARNQIVAIELSAQGYQGRAK